MPSALCSGGVWHTFSRERHHKCKCSNLLWRVWAGDEISLSFHRCQDLVHDTALTIAVLKTRILHDRVHSLGEVSEVLDASLAVYLPNQVAAHSYGQSKQEVILEIENSNCIWWTPCDGVELLGVSPRPGTVRSMVAVNDGRP